MADRQTHPAWLSLGANLGDKRAAIARALDLLAEAPGIRLVRRSRDFRTPPWGKTDQDWFVNAAAEIATTLTPQALLETVLGVEARMGRERREKWGPRLIDIDIIAFDDLRVTSPSLTLPHPHALERGFVLAPLAEIAPGLRIAGIAITDALARLDTKGIDPMDSDESSEVPAFDRSFDTPAGVMKQVSPLVRRILAPNPGPFTFTGTCTYIVGTGRVAVIDPGPAEEAHIRAILDALGRETVEKIVITHTHLDHTPGAKLLKAATGAPIVGCGPHVAARPLHDGEVRMEAGADRDYQPDIRILDGEVIEGQGYSLRAVATPGHTVNHLAFALAEENALFSGDHVMAWSTTVVAPPDGSMGDYMRSLDLLKGRPETIYWPGHGGPVTSPNRFVRALIHHRRMREASILTRIAAGDGTVPQIVAAIYEGLDPRLTGGASMSVFAHIEDLCERGMIVTDGAPLIGGRYRMA